MKPLKQSTAYTFRMGPFVDQTDANTAETALSIGASEVKVSKAGAALAAKSDATAPVHDADGYYTVVLNTTDTGTLGNLRVTCHPTGALPVWEDFVVMPANVYDSLFAGSDKLDVNAAEWAGAATANDDVAIATAPSNLAALAISGAGNVTVGGYLSGQSPADLVLATPANKLALNASGYVSVASFSADAITAAAIASAAANKIADHVLRRTAANARASSDGDTVSGRSLLGAIAKLVNRVAVSGTTLTIYGEDDSTSFFTQAITTNPSAEPITALDTN